MRSRLQGQRWLIESLRFQRGGTVQPAGAVGLRNIEPDVNVRMVLDKYQALDQPNRRLALSGEAQLLYTEAERCNVGRHHQSRFWPFRFSKRRHAHAG